MPAIIGNLPNQVPTNGDLGTMAFQNSDGVNITADARVNGLTIGRGTGAIATNTAFGVNVFSTNTTGTNSTAFGNGALLNQTSGGVNTAVGDRALTTNSTGEFNTGVGVFALRFNTTGTNNAALGVYALEANTTGSFNTAIGVSALDSNTSASNNTAVGYQAGYTQTTATQNTFFGQQAGYTTNASYNTFIGARAGNVSTGTQNTLVGAFAGNLLTTGTDNTFIGSAGNAGSGGAVTTGSKNTIIGNFSGSQGGLDFRTLNNRIVLSDGDGNPNIWNNGVSTVLNTVTGNRYTVLEMHRAGTYQMQMYWDTLAAGGAGAFFVQGASGGVYLNNTGTSWISNSDERLKENLVPIENGLSKVCSLRSVIGNFKSDEFKKPTPFLIAQDVQAVLPEAVTSTRLKDDETNTEYLGVSYTETIPLLVAAIKELNAKVEAQALEMAANKTEFDEYKRTHS